VTGDLPAGIWPTDWDFGLPPLRQTIDYAAAARALAEFALALERPSEDLGAVIEAMRSLDRQLRSRPAINPIPRVGDHAGDPACRPYLDHAAHIGLYNPVFPQYTMNRLSPETAEGSVRFPVVFEGPPGCVHGGFLALFFDVVIGHQSTEAGAAGKTKSLELSYLRPTPLGVSLSFAVERRIEGRYVISEARLFDADTVLCTARAQNVAGRRENLPAVGDRVQDP
jgi:acyl-coenzyme A thioesterase PaaI-like protein